MGRPPNPLIVEYFRRGPKLRDKSNRYEHSCRKCGFLDRTGRPEKLIDHLVKCSHLDPEQRQEILARHLSQRSGIRSNEEGLSSRSATPPAYAGLEGLAEAARRVSAHEPHAGSPLIPSTTIPIDPSIGYETTSYYAPAEALRGTPPSQEVYTSNGQAVPVIRHSATPEMYDHYAIVNSIEQQGAYNTSSATLFGLSTSESIQPAMNASLSLSKANNMAIFSPVTLPLQIPSSNQPPVSSQPLLATDVPIMMDMPVATPPLTTKQTPVSSREAPATGNQENIAALTTSTSVPPPTSTTSRAPSQLLSPSSTPGMGQGGTPTVATEFSPVSANNLADLENSPSSKRPKRTSKLQPQQREKTARMRRQGACIRCRLLKKPCSGEDPCQQCQSVHHPRTWRHPCQRVKLHEEITLYSAGLRSALAARQLQNLAETHVVRPDDPEANIRLSFADHESLMSFSALRYRENENNDTGSSIEFAIDTAAEASKQIESKMKRYLREEHGAILGAEQSPVLRKTLKLARRIASDQNDEILSSTLELWAGTFMLTDDTDHIKVVLVVHHGSDVEQTSITKQSHKQSYEIIRGQILAAVEKNLSDQFRKLLVRLEARLQKPKSCLFETFLACLLLLSCAERMCCLIRRWQIPEVAEQPWPLFQEQPGQLLQQGETMASVLHMVMDMRNVLPKPHSTVEGKLIVPPTSSEDLRMWFNAVDLSTPMLRMLTARPYVAHDMRSMDGRFWARTLLSVDDRTDGLA